MDWKTLHLSTSCLGMSISSLWKAPLSMTARGALVAGSRASRDKLWSITRASTIASVSGIEKAPCSYIYLLNITNGNHSISIADLEIIVFPFHFIVFLELTWCSLRCLVMGSSLWKLAYSSRWIWGSCCGRAI